MTKLRCFWKVQRELFRSNPRKWFRTGRHFLRARHSKYRHFSDFRARRLSQNSFHC